LHASLLHVSMMFFLMRRTRHDQDVDTDQLFSSNNIDDDDDLIRKMYKLAPDGGGVRLQLICNKVCLSGRIYKNVKRPYLDGVEVV
jgi:hypothetical protein